LWTFVTLFGSQLLLFWNVLAILLTFIVNYSLNSVITWKSNSPIEIKRTHSHKNRKLFSLCAVTILVASLGIVAVGAQPSQSNTAQGILNDLFSNQETQTNNQTQITNQTEENEQEQTKVTPPETVDKAETTENQTEQVQLLLTLHSPQEGTYNDSILFSVSTNIPANISYFLNEQLSEACSECTAFNESWKLSEENYSLSAIATTTNQTVNVTTQFSVVKQTEIDTLEEANETMHTDTEVINLAWTNSSSIGINPFFSDNIEGPVVVGSDSVKINVFTAHNQWNFSQLHATITSNSGSTNHTLERQFTGDTETHWSKIISEIDYGNNALTRIEGRNETGTYVVVTGDFDRQHYRTEPPRATSSGASRTGGGGAIAIGPRTPEIIYAVFSDDVITQNNTVQLTMDVHSAYATQRVQVIITDAHGETEVELTLDEGSEYYGTWRGTISPTRPGPHTLTEVHVETVIRKMTAVQTLNASFYVLGVDESIQERLVLLHGFVSANQIDPQETITLEVDVRDSNGITQVTGLLRNTAGTTPDIRVPLHLVSGDKHHGTWKGNVTLDKQDTTYMFFSATLENEAEETIESRVYNQLVYVNHVPPDTQAQLQAQIAQQSTFQRYIEQINLAYAGLALVVTMILSGAVAVIATRQKKTKDASSY